MLRRQTVIVRALVLVGLIGLRAGTARADDAYYVLRAADISTEAAKAPKPMPSFSYRGEREGPRVLLEGDGEAYPWFGGADPQRPEDRNNGDLRVLIRTAAARDVAGRLFVRAEDGKARVGVPFHLAASKANAAGRVDFLKAKLAYDEDLLRRGVPGAAWFRHEAAGARRALGNDAPAVQPDQLANRRADDLEATFGLFSGGRSISENLQLDRGLLPRPGGADETVALASLEGITVSQMKWKPLIEGKHPALDPLAEAIPADQHAVFFPTFDAMVRLMDEVDRQATPVVQFAEPHSEDALTKQRYQRQLCLPMTGLGRLMGPRVIKGVAITGSDAYLRVGSDVAVLFEPKDPTALHQLLATQMGMAAGGATQDNLTSDALSYTGYRTADRRTCAYLADVGKYVVVTNSPAQLQRLLKVNQGKAASIASTPEYTFFRDRYPLGEADELGFIVLTDATIRRWCSPRWRIADSRRTRAAAVMAEAQARHADPIVAGKGTAVHIDDEDLVGAGELTVGPDGVQSSTYGTLEFMTPVVEMEVTKVTEAEAATYRRWRDTYQQNWRNYFDPIALRFSGSPDRLAADLTVIPLIAGSEYRDLIEFSRGAKLAPASGDPHGALAHVALAINSKSDRFRQMTNLGATFAPQLGVDPLSWIGPAVGWYVDDDPIWAEAAKADKPDEFLLKHFDGLPVALYAESNNALKLAAFLTAVHAFVDQSAPALLTWETLKYNDVAYVKVAPTPATRERERDVANVALYYTTAGGRLLLTPSEALLKRALDRQAAPAAAAGKDAGAKAGRPWAGESLCLQVDGAGLSKYLGGLLGESARSEVRQRAWDDLPILNEWRRRYPDRDPLDVHERLWQVRLQDPAAGTYAWNEALGTMESTAFGCPEAPKVGPVLPAALRALRDGNFGITFEPNQGLRARAELYWKSR